MTASRNADRNSHPSLNRWAMIVLGLFLLAGVIWALNRPSASVNAPTNARMNASSIAAEMNRRVKLPIDLGDGLSLESISAQDNAVAFILKSTNTPPDLSPEDIATLERAMVSDACRTLVRERELLTKHQIDMIKEMRDESGRRIAAARIRAADCP